MPLPDTALALLVWLDRYARRIAFEKPGSPERDRVALQFEASGHIEVVRAPTLPAAILRAAAIQGRPLPGSTRRAKPDQRQGTFWP